MNYKQLESFRLGDAIKFHDKLNPNLWLGNRLRPEVKKQLKKIAEDFIEEVDLTVSGSNAAYSYTPYSDLDLHILVNMRDLPNNDVYKELFNAKKNIYNDSHNIKIHGIPVELYVQDVNEPVVSLGEFSIIRDKWLKMPSKLRANFDQTATKAKYEKLHELIQHALKTKNLKIITNVIKKIKQYRQAGLAKAGEFGPENLAYKVLRNQDYITKLYDLRDKLHSEELTIETMYSTPESTKLLDRPTLTIRKLAAKHDVSVNHIMTQLQKGIKVEKQHTTYSQTAREIVLDHLSDDPNYYIKSKKDSLEEVEEFEELPSSVYHVTPSENLDSIMSQGLIPQKGERSRKILDEKPAIYCFPDKNTMEDAVMNWLGDEFDEDEALALLEIDTTGLDGQVTDGAKYEIAITSSIPVENIRILSKDLAMPLNESSSYAHTYNDEVQLHELYSSGDTLKNWDWNTFNDKLATSIFLVDEQVYKLQLKLVRKDSGIWNIEFMNMSTPGENGFSILGTGNAPLVLSNAVEIIRDFLNKKGNNVKRFTYTAIEPSRQRLYRSIAKRVAPDWKLAQNHENFTLTRPSLNESSDDNAEAYKANLIKSLPQIMKLFANVGKGWSPSKEQLLAAVDTGYTVMKHTGDTKLAGKAVMDKLNSLHRMSQSQQGLSEASGYIPSEKEKNDPRFKTALTVDVRPDAIKKNAKAFGFKVNRAGIPPTLKP
jgi:hypothetical protein